MSADASLLRGEMPSHYREPPRVPSHGGGMLRQFAPGNLANPGGRTNPLKRVQALARAKSFDAVQRLSEIIERNAPREPNSDGAIAELPDDPRVVIVAAQTLLTWAWGKPPEYNPDEDAMRDITSMTPAQRMQRVIEILRTSLAHEIDGKAEEPKP